MTITEAAHLWNVKEETIIRYLTKGFIYDIYIEDEKLVLPEIKKPKVISKNQKRNTSNYYKWILQACDKNEYINAKLMGIDDEIFNSCINQLEKSGFIDKTQTATMGTNVGYVITMAGVERLRSMRINRIKLPPIEIKANVGAGNIML